jgi:cytochrome c oxidase subunit 3
MNKTTGYPTRRRGETRAVPMRRGTARITLLIVLGAETAFFGVMVSAYLYMRASQAEFPFVHAQAAQLILPAANTALLLASALTAALAHRSIRQGQASGLVSWLQITLVFGLVFIAGQAFEYIRSGMSPADQAFGGIFFTLMGFHALHLVAGSLILALVLARAQGGDFTARRHTAVDVGVWFWYFVVGVWMVLFTVLFLV